MYPLTAAFPILYPFKRAVLSLGFTLIGGDLYNQYPTPTSDQLNQNLGPWNLDIKNIYIF